MDDWLTTHALFVTAVAGAIYLAQGRHGFSALSSAGVVIEPRKLALLFALPAVISESYWRRYLARPNAKLIFTDMPDPPP